MTKTNNIKNEQHFYSDSSFWSLLIANIITMTWALKEGWSLDLMIWVYFSQNVILGIFWPAKVFGASVDSSYTNKIKSIAVFIPHYFMLHFLYAVSLYNYFGKELSVNFKPIIILAGIFFLSETFSCFVENGINRQISLAKTQLFPYARVIPMHFVMLIGLFLQTEDENARFGITVFLFLKALADIAMHMVERSSVFADLVTASFEMYNEEALLELDYSNLKGEQEVCRFCQRVIGRNETPRLIKENVVCEECYNRIEKEKKETS